jgi:hypothetical protein
MFVSAGYTPGVRALACLVGVLAAACESPPGRHDAATDGLAATCHAQADCPGQACCLYVCNLGNCYPPHCADPMTSTCWYTVCDPDAGACTTRSGAAGTCQAVSQPIG